MEELLEELYNTDISKIDEQELERYKEQYANDYQGIYGGYDDKEIQIDLYLHLSDNKKIEIINQLNDMLSKYQYNKNTGL